VLLKKAGSALNFEDHPIGKDYKFTAEDVANGHLARQIVTTLSGGRDDYESQQYYRQRVHSEKQQFYMQVRNFFFNLNAKRKTPIDQNSG
jgi:hypothetical protein